jgi:hypothetical protein
VWRWVSTWTRSRAATRSCNSTWQCPRLANRIDTHAADLFDDEYPSGYDCLLFAHQLVIWTPAQNRTLWGKAHRALASGGRVLIFNAFSDDDGHRSAVHGAGQRVLQYAALPWQHDLPVVRLRGLAAHVRVHHLAPITLDTWTPHGVIEACTG